MSESQSSERRDFVPALGRHELTGAYDRVVAVSTRERLWRARLVEIVGPRPGETIVDVGCGTGTLAVALKKAVPGVRVVGVDPDEAVLAVARAKAIAAGVEVEWRRAMGDELAGVAGAAGADKAVSSLVFHQCPLPMKRDILVATHAALAPGGRLFVADYGEQRSLLMRLLFLQVRTLDGFENTRPNADGRLPSLVREAGFADVAEPYTLATPTGSISIYTAVKAGADR